MSGNPPPGVPADLITPQGNMPAIGIPNSQDYARLIFSAPYFEQIPIAEIIQPSVTEAVEAVLPSLVPPYVDAAVLAGVQQYAVLLTGSTMSGPLFLNPLMPTADAQAATKAYVDTMLATAGIPEVPPVPVGQIWGRETGQWVPISQAEGAFLPISGGTMQGNINMSGNTLTNMAAVPAMPNGAAPAQWVLNQIASVSLYQGTWDADTNVPDLTQLSTHVNAYTWIAITTSPSGVVIGPAIPGLQGMTVFNGDTIIFSTAQGAFSAIHAGGISLPEADGRYVQLAGSQMSGALLLNANASQNMQAVTFQQLEAAVANTVTPDAPADGQGYLRVGVGTTRWVPGLPLAGGILTGALTLAGPGASGNNAVTVTQLNSAVSGVAAGLMPIAGGTFTGAVILNGNATANLNPVPLQQMNAMLATYATQAFVTGQLANYLPLAGGTMTGALTINTSTNPALNLTGTGVIHVAGTATSTFQGGITTSGSLTAVNAAVTATLSAGTGASAGVVTAGTVINNDGVRYNGVNGQNFVAFQWASTPNNFFNCWVDGQFVGNITPAGSDPKLKTNIGPVEVDMLGVINEIALHQFDFTLPPPLGAEPQHWTAGFMSDQLAPLIPEAVNPGSEATFDTVNALPLIAYLVGAVQQLSARVAALDGRAA